jgi:glycyl-tRNA synthetase
MAFIVKKNIHGKEYYYLRKSKRIDGKVKSICLAYLGKTKKDAEKKAREILKATEQKAQKEEKTISEDKVKTEQKKSRSKPELKKISIEELATFCRRKGFVYQSGEIYGGFAGFWDFGHLGTEIKNNIKKEWWKSHVTEREDIVGIDGSVITHPKVWEASGHVDGFSDWIVICKKCKKPGKAEKNELGKAKCEFCGGDYDESTAKEFKLMFETAVGEDSKGYLRPETAQLIFINFKSIYENARLKLPCGIAQIGKAFRNEIAPRDFLFRLREFEQMEIEYFINPRKSSCPYKIPNVEILIYSEEMQKKGKEPEKMKISEALKKKIIKKDWHAYWLATEFLWFKNLGANPENFRLRQHLSEELSHYSADTWDLEYNFPFGWKELEGIADRGDYDLSQHEKFSGKDLKIFDEEINKKILPHVICEPSLGVERAFLVFMLDSYFYDKERENIVLKINPKLAPIKAAIFPIVKINKKIVKISRIIYEELKKEFDVIYDAGGSIGRRYSRNDEIGTPFCITVDEESLKKNDVTVRNRDTQKQIRVKISELRNILGELIRGEIEFKKAGESFD